MQFPKPGDVFDRDVEWSDLAAFAAGRAAGLRLAIMSGRRRRGKSYLLRRLARASGALYRQAQEIERTQALSRFADDVAARLGIGRSQLHFADWETALRTALGYNSILSAVAAGQHNIAGIGGIIGATTIRCVIPCTCSNPLAS